MNCPNCQADHSEVKDSRPVDGGIRRRRLCGACGERFTTFEVVAEAPPGDMLGPASAQRVRHFRDRATAELLDAAAGLSAADLRLLRDMAARLRAAKVVGLDEVAA